MMNYVTKTNMKGQTLAVFAIGLSFIVAVLAEVKFLNGPGYQHWPWRHLDLFRSAFLLGAPLIALAFVLFRIETPPKQRWGLLALLVACSFGMQIMGILADPASLPLIKEIVDSPRSTSYFTDALDIGDPAGWLAHYDRATLGLHSSTHPPGPILFYYACLKLFGPDVGAYVGGCLVGFAGSLGIVVFYYFSRLWTTDVRLRLTACAFYGLLPGLVLFFPEFDQLYPIFSMLLIICWVKALDGQREYSVYFGFILFVATFFAYSLLAIGAFVILYALYFLLWKDHASWVTLSQTSLVSVGICGMLYASVSLTTRYAPIQSFHHALVNQSLFSAKLGRPYLTCLLSDVYDFLLGAGIVALPLLGFYLYRSVKEFTWERSDIVLSFVGLATILIVDLTGLVRGETARVWLFLQPLLVMPVALELDRFNFVERSCVFGLLWLVMLVLKCKMWFIQP